MSNIDYTSNSTSKSTTKQHFSVYCSHCWNDDDVQNDATQFCQDCQLPLCDKHVTLHQQTKNTNNHSLVHVHQIPEDQHPDLFEHKKIDKLEEESLYMTSHE